MSRLRAKRKGERIQRMLQHYARITLGKEEKIERRLGAVSAMLQQRGILGTKRVRATDSPVFFLHRDLLLCYVNGMLIDHMEYTRGCTLCVVRGCPSCYTQAPKQRCMSRLTGKLVVVPYVIPRPKSFPFWFYPDKDKLTANGKFFNAGL